MKLMTLVRQWLRKHIPKEFRQHIAHLRRVWDDRLTGSGYGIVRAPPDFWATAKFERQLTLTQAIHNAEHSAGKIENICLAATRLSNVSIPPDAVISFWILAGPPTAALGFKMGRAIIGDRVTADIGGGLCQISGLLYELGLRAGLQIVERHAHTRDLYTEESRFTPLGLDATVVWGTKDLRLRNTLSQPIAFSFQVGDGHLSGSLLAPYPLRSWPIKIVRSDISHSLRRAEVYRESMEEGERLVSADLYIITPSSAE